MGFAERSSIRRRSRRCNGHALEFSVQVLFALNGRYFLNEKGALALVETFPLHPAGFRALLSEGLGLRGANAELPVKVERMEGVVNEVRKLSTIEPVRAV